MSLARFSVKNSLLVNIISVFIIIVGLHAMFTLPLDMFPAVDFDIVTITTSYPGSPAEDVEKFVTTPIEKELFHHREVDPVQAARFTDALADLTTQLYQYLPTFGPAPQN